MNTYMATYTIEGKRVAHISPRLKTALKWSYDEAKTYHRIITIYKLQMGKKKEEKATVWWYNGSIENIRNKVLVKMTGRKWQYLKANGLVGKRDVKL